jgi:pimeloyl-ACP methyl ester carboxylesterase
MADTTERIGDLALERRRAAPPARPVPLLFVHGMGGGSWYFGNYLEAAAAAGWECWALNLRGHHGSRPVADLGGVSVKDYVNDAMDALEAIGPAAILGHSMGGLVAQRAAAHRHVRAAAFLTSAAPRGIAVVRWPVLARAWRYLGPILRDGTVRARDADNVALVLNRMSAPERQRVLARFVGESGRAARELALGQIAVDASLVRCPTLVVAAREDRITPPAVQRRIARKYGSTYLEVVGHAHMLMLEEGWEGPLEMILAWLEGAAGAPRARAGNGDASRVSAPGS